MNKSLAIIILFSLVVSSFDRDCLCDVVSPTLANLVRIPLTRATTLDAGRFGQPVINYYTTVKIGTPPIELNLQFEVDFGDTFVPHYNWNIFKNYLHYTKGFKCKLSTTCSKKPNIIVVEYQQCTLTGKIYEDLMTLGGFYANRNNLSATHHGVLVRQNFLAISDASTTIFKNLPIDGYIGLGPQTRSTSSVNNILVSLKDSKVIDRPQFSLWFNPVLDNTQGGEIILGGVDPNRYQGQIYWHSVSISHENSWMLTLQYVSVGSQTVACNGDCKVNFSSGLNEVYGPRSDVDKIYSYLKVTPSDMLSDLKLIDCSRVSSLPIITFTLDGIPYSLLPSNYIRKTTDGLFKKETCFVAIFPNDSNQNQWTLGTNFLGAYYSIFDLQFRQIGFASLR